MSTAGCCRILDYRIEHLRILRIGSQCGIGFLLLGDPVYIPAVIELTGFVGDQAAVVDNGRAGQGLPLRCSRRIVLFDQEFKFLFDRGFLAVDLLHRVDIGELDLGQLLVDGVPFVVMILNDTIADDPAGRSRFNIGVGTVIRHKENTGCVIELDLRTACEVPNDSLAQIAKEIVDGTLRGIRAGLRILSAVAVANIKLAQGDR